jgi:hypothetical protein
MTGTGKSVLLREIIAALRRKYAREPDRVAVTASTGLAACNIVLPYIVLRVSDLAKSP